MSAFQHRPYWMEENVWPQEKYDEVQESRTAGRDFIILDTIAQALNFSINVLPYADWDKVMMRLQAREGLILPLKLAIMPHLLEKYDFTLFIERATVGFSMAKPTLKPSWQGLYYPLQVEVWISILAAVLVVCTALLLTMKHSGDSETYKVWAVVKQVVGTLLDEPVSGHLPLRNSTRVMLTAWMVSSFIVGTVYRSNLTASLTVPKYPPRVETLKQLIDSEANITVPPDMIDFVDNFKTSGSKLLHAVGERTECVPSSQVGMQEAISGNKAYLYEQLHLKLLIAEQYTDKGGSTPLYVAEQSLLPGYCGWPLAPNTPFKANLDKYISAFHGAGLIDKWTTEVLERAQFNSRRRQNRVADESSATPQEEDAAGTQVHIALTLVHIQGPLLLYLVGTCISFWAFLGEASVTPTFILRHHSVVKQVFKLLR